MVVSQNVQRIARDELSIRQDPGEYYFLIFQDHGQSLMCQQGVQFRMRPGDFMLIDSTKPSDFIYEGVRSQQISLHLRRDEMPMRFGHTIHAGIGILRQDPLGLAMRAVLAKILEPKNQESSHLKEAFLAVFGSFLLEQGCAGAATRATSNEDLLSVAMRHIAVRFQDPGFNAAALATALNLKPRSLQRLFQRVGATPSRSILDARLNAAQGRLRARVTSLHTEHISSVAYDCGFNDLSFFYREFRKKFGRTPGAVP